MVRKKNKFKESPKFRINNKAILIILLISIILIVVIVNPQSQQPNTGQQIAQGGSTGSSKICDHHTPVTWTETIDNCVVNMKRTSISHPPPDQPPVPCAPQNFLVYEQIFCWHTMNSFKAFFSAKSCNAAVKQACDEAVKSFKDRINNEIKAHIEVCSCPHETTKKCPNAMVIPTNDDGTVTCADSDSMGQTGDSIISPYTYQCGAWFAKDGMCYNELSEIPDDWYLYKDIKTSSPGG